MYNAKKVRENPTFKPETLKINRLRFILNGEKTTPKSWFQKHANPSMHWNKQCKAVCHVRQV